MAFSQQRVVISQACDFIAFPKNNMGRDMMIDAPSAVDQGQLDELGLAMVE